MEKQYSVCFTGTAYFINCTENVILVYHFNGFLLKCPGEGGREVIKEDITEKNGILYHKQGSVKQLMLPKSARELMLIYPG